MLMLIKRGRSMRNFIFLIAFFCSSVFATQI
ncbi:TPA: YgcG family protein, partial [Escherichia coli]